MVYSHDYRQPMAIAQVLPALVGMSYLEAASLDCTASTGASPTLQPSLSPKPSTTTAPSGMASPSRSSPRQTPRG